MVGSPPVESTVQGPRSDGMTLAGVRELLQAEALWMSDLSVRVSSVVAADLMSDVLTTSRPGMLLLTGLANIQAVRTATIADLVGVVFIGGKRPTAGVIAVAREHALPVLSTRMSMFEAAGLLFQAVSAPLDRERGGLQ